MRSSPKIRNCHFLALPLWLYLWTTICEASQSPALPVPQQRVAPLQGWCVRMSRMKINLQQPRATKVLFSGQDNILSKSEHQSVFFVSLPLPICIVSANHPRGCSFEDTTNSGTKKPSKKSVGQDTAHSFISTATSNFASSQRHGRSGNRSVAMIGIDRNQCWTTSKPTSG